MFHGVSAAPDSPMPKILLTGGTGFVGRPLLKALVSSRYQIINVVRKSTATTLPDVQDYVISSLSGENNWGALLQGVEVVIHSAGRAHVMNETHNNPLQAFRDVNVDATLNLARQASKAGVKRFVFISSVKVNGEETKASCPFTSSDTPAPLDDYGVSKLEAEQALMALAAQTLMEVVIIRPVLVYGPGVKANFQKMLSFVSKGIPLPFRTINNRRSLIFIDNLIDFICLCIHHPAATNRVFLVSDGDDLSIGEILEKLSVAMNKKSRLFAFPQPALELLASLIGKREFFQRLCGSLQVDITDAKERLGWKPPVSVDNALAITARYYQEEQSGAPHG
ncbi:UDP-glucose 4-epimerase family protein [Pseudomonas synxantha]|uniref:UDP-glucose 4-epimerase family protein n=1 Tax=Pseudomonas synxantha TaxID=47883 RepID=UPI000F712597|nr:SDR family oxidoreductase [Pseudomonas synxantha]AZE77575.1 UDP-glucose 4-epimerase [Pseudomonas synxantha]